MSKKKIEGIPAIKGFNRDLTCRGFQFEPRKTYTHDGAVKVCSSGFHSCPVDDETPPHAVFEYHAPGVSRYFDITASGQTDREGNKIASASVTIGVEITMGELMRRVAEWCVKKAKGAATNSGSYGAATNSGYSGAATNSGYYGAATNSGYSGAATNSGYSGAATNSGYSGAATNSGDSGAASNSGSYGAATNSGYSGAATNSGYSGAATNSGYSGAATNSGDYGAAMSHSYGGKVMCEGDGQALYCSEFNNGMELVSNACGITGRDGIKAGVWYVCRDGKLEEVKQ